MARIVEIAASPDWQRRAHAELDAGRCLAMPTETVYGLAADATNGIAVARIFEMKGRPRLNPLICHVGSVAMAEGHCDFDRVSSRLAEAFWPGPLTVVLPKRKDSDIHELATAGLATVGLRWPKGPAGDLIARFGKPLAAPSANPSGRLSPTTAQHVADAFAATDLLILDGGPCPVGLESTIVKASANTLTVLRPGAITAEEIEAVAGAKVVVAGQEAAIEAPGMLASHYAPRAGLALNAQQWPAGAAVLAFGPLPEDAPPPGELRNLSLKRDSREAAANLYSHLKQLDASGAAVIHVMPIPLAGIGAAINDRLARAAAPRN